MYKTTFGEKGFKPYLNYLKMTATVKYQIATYNGTVLVPCRENDEDELIIAKAKSILRRKVGSFPLGYESWKILSLE